MARRYYRPSYQTESPLARALSGALAVWTGQQQGRQAREQEDRQLAEMKRRQAMQDEDQAMQRFQFGANLERQAMQDEDAPIEAALRNPNVVNPDELIQHLMRPRQRMFTPNAFSGMRATGQMPSPQSPVGTAPQVTPVPRIVPQQIRDAYTVPIQMRERRLAEGIEDANEAAFIQRELLALRKGQAAGTPFEQVNVGAEYGFPMKVRPSLPPTKVNAGDARSLEGMKTQTEKDLRDYITFGGPEEDQAQREAEVLSYLQQVRGLRINTREEADNARQFFSSAPLIGLITRVNAKRQQWKDEQKAKKNEDIAKFDQAEWNRLNSAIENAKKARNAKDLALTIAKQRDLLDKHPEWNVQDYARGAIDPRPQERTRRIPIMPKIVTAEDLDNLEYREEKEKETADEALARAADELGDFLKPEDPEAALKLKKEAIGRLWMIAKDPKYTEGARNDALERIQSISKNTGLEDVYPKTIKLEQYTPFQRYNIERNRVLDAARKQEREQIRRGRELDIRKKEQDILKIKRELASPKWTDSQKFAQKGALDILQNEAKEANDAIARLEKIDYYFRPPDYDTQIKALQAKRDEALRRLYQGVAGGDALGTIRQQMQPKPDKFGFTPDDYVTIKILQTKKGLTYEEAANAVRRDNQGR